MRRVLLASTSPIRRRILEEAGFEVRCAPPGVDESLFTDPDPASRAVSLARAKARALPGEPGVPVIGADQVAFDPDRGEVFGKPRNDEDHLARLLGLSGRWHELVTGVCVRMPGGPEVAFAERSRIALRGDLGLDEIRAYVATGEARGCAGGYAVEGRGAFLIERIDGDYTNVLGLPLYAVWGALRALGWRFDG